MKMVIAGIAVCLTLAVGQAVEQPVSFDSAGHVFRLSPALNVGAGAFAEFSGFDHLELWRTPEGLAVEIYRADGTRERVSVPEDRLGMIRRQVDAYLARPSPARLDQTGRGSFLLQQIPLALGWYGPATAAILIPNEDFRWQAALSLVVSSAAYFGPFSAMRNMKMTGAQAHLAVANGYRGVLAGYLIGHIFHRSAYRAYSTIMMGTSVAGEVAGYRLAEKLTLGQATLVTAYTDQGTIDGALFGAAVTEWTQTSGHYNTSLSSLTLVGMVAGSVWGNWLAPKWNCTEGQVVALRTGTIVGGAVPAVLHLALAKPEKMAATWLLALAGTGLGTWWTQHAIHDASLTNGNGMIVTGVTLGGALLGSGLGVAISKEEEVIAVAASAGALGGLVGGIALAKNLQMGQTAQGYMEPRIEFNYAAIVNGATSYAIGRGVAVPNLLTIRF